MAGFEVTPVGRFSTDPRGRKLIQMELRLLFDSRDVLLGSAIMGAGILLAVIARLLDRDPGRRI